jgi:hypothetical protein
MNALSSQEVAALREGDIVFVRMEVRKPLGEFGTIQCRISNGACTSHHLPVSPEHIFGRVTRWIKRQLRYVGFRGQSGIVVLDWKLTDSDPSRPIARPHDLRR